MERIGRYQVMDEVGRGAMGVVYRGQDPTIGRVIAIKTIRLADLTDGAERQRLRDRLFREAQSAGILSHPNIVTIYDIAEENGMAYIFMEFVNGPPLEKLLAAPDTLEPAQVLNILRQTALALDYAHRKGIVHRDIKPANIMVHDDGQAKVTDFGVAKIVSQQMTQTGAMMGTPSYMSPEQVQGQTVDGRADQFSLAVIAYEVMTGEKPFVADYLPTLLYKIVREEPAPAHRINPAIGPEIEETLRKALSKDPNSRFATCSEFVEALGVACSKSPDWRPMSSGSSQSQETLARTELDAGPALAPAIAEVTTVASAAVASASGAPVGLPVALPVSLPPPVRPARLDDAEGNPLFKNVVKILVVMAILGGLYAAAHFYLLVPSNTATSTPANAGATPAPNTKSDAAPAPPPPAPATAPPVAAPPKPDERTQPPGSKVEAVVKKPVVRAERPPETDVPAVPSSARSIQFVTSPPGALLTIDGDNGRNCKSPCQLSLPAGRHVLAVTLSGYRPSKKIFEAPKESEIFVDLDKLGGTLSVVSEPPGATMAIDGKLQARRSPATFSLPPGHHEVDVSLDGRRARGEVDLIDGDFKMLTLRLQ